MIPDVPEAHFPLRLLQHKETHLYYKSPGSWTSSADEADHFKDLSSAAQFCWNQHLDQVELVLNFGLPIYDIRLPVTDESDHLRLLSFSAVSARKAGEN
jgi:hypothetical protein